VNLYALSFVHVWYSTTVPVSEITSFRKKQFPCKGTTMREKAAHTLSSAGHPYAEPAWISDLISVQSAAYSAVHRPGLFSEFVS
jgi:hypothetical protein